MVAYFVDRDAALARELLPDLEHPVFMRLEDDGSIWAVYTDREVAITALDREMLGHPEHFVQVSIDEANGLLSIAMRSVDETAVPPGVVAREIMRKLK